MSHADVVRYMRAMGSHEMAELNEVPECPRPFVPVRPAPLPVKAYGERIVRCVCGRPRVGQKGSSMSDEATRLFQINETDLARLEAILPRLFEHLWTPDLDNATRVKIRQVQNIISDVRWGYGPPSEVVVIPANPDKEPTP